MPAPKKLLPGLPGMMLLLSLSAILFLQCATSGTVPEAPLLRRIEPGSLSSYHFRAMDYSIAPWFRFKSTALSLTFDDGTLDQYLIAFPELEGRDIKATFFLVTGPRDKGYWQDSDKRRVLFSWDQAREMAISGHEIGSHGKSHDRLYGDGSFVDEQLRESQAKIDREIRSRRCVSFSWPFWKSDGDSRLLAQKYFISARAGGPDPARYALKNGGIVTPNPYDIYQINAMGILSSEQFPSWVYIGDKISSKHGWAVINLHGIDDGAIDRNHLGWRALSVESLRRLLDYVEKSDSWIAPFGRVSRYIQERQAANVRLIGIEADSITLSLTDNLDNEIFDQALTLMLKLPEPWENAEVQQNGLTMWSQINEKEFLLFDAFPDRGAIVIRSVDPLRHE